MREYLICNGVPAYKEAPVATDIMKNSTSQIVKSIHLKKASKNYIILDQNEKGVKAKLEAEAENYPDMNLEIISVEGSFGFVYGNSSAIAKVIASEKPIPSSLERNESVYSIEMLLDSENTNVYVEGGVKKKGKYTFSKKTTPREILKSCDLKGKFKGIYLGYPMGELLGEGNMDNEIELTTDYVRILSDEDCVLDQLKDIAGRYAKETCGRCVFGHEGVTQINMILLDITQKKGKPDDIALLLDLCDEMRHQVLCEVGVSLATTINSAITNFKEEIEGHITKKTCRSAVCSKFITYHILADQCTGCNECQDACKDDAILGKKKFVHVIDQDECTQCGDCLEACEEGAIVKAGRIKPRTPLKPIPCKR